MEQAFENAGLRIIRTDELGAELMEFYEEREGRASRELMRLARMRRLRDQLLPEWGESRYHVVEALYTWVTYQLLGKLSSVVYVLQQTT